MPGMRVEITEVPQDYAIDFHDGDWWVRYQGEWIDRLLPRFPMGQLLHWRILGAVVW